MVRNNLKSLVLEPSNTKEFGKRNKKKSGIRTWRMRNIDFLNLSLRVRGNAVSRELGDVS